MQGLMFVFSRFFCEEFDEIVSCLKLLREEGGRDNRLKTLPILLVAMNLDPRAEDSDVMSPVSRDYIHRTCKEYDVRVVYVSKDAIKEEANVASQLRAAHGQASRHRLGLGAQLTHHGQRHARRLL